MNEDGSLRDPDDAPIARENAHPVIARGTSDLFQEVGPLVSFFSFMLGSAELDWFQSPGAGYESPAFRELVAKGVRVTNAHVNSLPIAEFVVRSVLEEFQNAALWRDQALARRWQIHDWREVSGSTWLIVGLGAIGTEVAHRARAFGALVIGSRLHPSPTDPTERTVTPDQLDQVIGLADAMVLAAPATPETENLVGADFLSRMKARSLLVNVARGTLIDDDALIESLDSGHLSAAVLDVFRIEPLPDDHPFWSHPSIRVTPHNAAGGIGRLQRQAELFKENLERYLDGRPLLNEVTDTIARRTGRCQRLVDVIGVALSPPSDPSLSEQRTRSGFPHGAPLQNARPLRFASYQLSSDELSGHVPNLRLRPVNRAFGQGVGVAGERPLQRLT
jgi:glyoxylate/hydroxypyruvate reductase